MYKKTYFDDKHQRKQTICLTIRLFLMRIYRLRSPRKYTLICYLFVCFIFLYFLMQMMLPERYGQTLILDNQRHLSIRLFKDDDPHRTRIRPFRILSGSLHYFRVLPQSWSDRIEQMKKAGLNTIETYIPWNLHENERGVYKFNEGLMDLISFLRLIHQHEMFAIVRPSGKNLNNYFSSNRTLTRLF